MKIGIIRCTQTEDMCPGSTDFECARDGEGVFAELGPVEIVGFVGCGGCPGKKAVSRAENLADRGAEAIVLASCIGRGTPIGMPCPHFRAMKKAIRENLDEAIRLYDYTH